MTSISTIAPSGPHSLPSAAPWRHILAGDRSRAKTIACCVMLAVAALAAHGVSLTSGLFFDDYHHIHQLQRIGWSPSELLHAATIEPSRFIDMWWQDGPALWQYSRPISIALMKLVYEISGNSPIAQHAVSLILHWIAACLVCCLTLSLSRSHLWSLVAGLLFVVYSHSVFAVGWLAAQNTILQTLCCVAGLLTYLRASGLDVGPESSIQEPRPPQPLARSWFAATLGFWFLALFSRENAIVLPVLLLGFDAAFGGRKQVLARWKSHLLLIIIAAGFLTWRMGFYYHPMPDFYARRSGVEGYTAWWFAKLLHYLCSAVWLSPMVVGPTGRLHPFTETPGDYLLAGGIITTMGLGYFVACRNVRGWWIWPLWLILSLLPVVHILPTPHQGYSCGAPFAIAMVLGPALAPIVKPQAQARCARWVAAWFLFATCLYMPIYQTLWRGMVAAEHYTLTKLAADDPPPPDSDVFFINLPFVNIYAQTSLADAWKLPENSLRCHVLTFSPHTIRVEDRCIVEQIDGHRFTVEIEGEGYFSGVLGRFLLEGLRGGRPLPTDTAHHGPLFDTRVLAGGASGASKLEFTFRQPLASERYRFYLTSAEHPAMRLCFGRRPAGAAERAAPTDMATSAADVQRLADLLHSGDAGAAASLAQAAESADAQVRTEARAIVLPAARSLASALGAPIQRRLGASNTPPEDWIEVCDWWRRTADASHLADLYSQAGTLESLRATRDSIYTVQAITGRIIRSDLYMTGPPFEGPKTLFTNPPPPLNISPFAKPIGH